MFIANQCVAGNSMELNDPFWLAMASSEIQNNQTYNVPEQVWEQTMLDLDRSYCGV